MKKNNLKLLLTALLITTTSMVFAACSGKDNNSKDTSKGEKTQSITSLGSTALKPLVEESAKKFKEKKPKVTINVQGGGSGAGISQVSEGTVEIGNSDVPAESKLKDKEKAKELVDHKVCVIGFSIVTHKDLKVDNLTKEQIQGIFTGKYTNWKEVGGEDLKINVINRPKSSGTRATFKDTIMEDKNEKEDIGIIQDSSDAVSKSIQATKGSISYLALSYLTEEKSQGLKLLKIDGVEATKENIINKKYPFWSYEHMYTKGEPEGLTKEFLEYMMSDDNKENVEKLGYIPIGDFK